MQEGISSISKLVSTTTIQFNSSSNLNDLLLDIDRALDLISEETKCRRSKVETLLFGLSLAGKLNNNEALQINERLKEAISNTHSEKNANRRFYGIGDDIIKHCIFPYSTKRKNLLGLKTVVHSAIKYQGDIFVPYADLVALDFILSDAFNRYNKNFHEKIDCLDMEHDNIKNANSGILRSGPYITANASMAGNSINMTSTTAGSNWGITVASPDEVEGVNNLFDTLTELSKTKATRESEDS